MKRLLPFIIFTSLLLPLMAQDDGDFPSGETNWTGIRFQIMFLKRIQENHLLVGIRIIATDKAPEKGTLIGIPRPIPPNANPSDIAAGLYNPSPFTMDSSVMTDELTQKAYPVVPSVAPPGHKYRPAVMLEMLAPGQTDMVTLQFEVPPPPPSEPGQPPLKQTLSFLFTNAKAPIKHVPLPPPTSTGP